MLSAQMRLGGANTQIGWLFLGFGSIFFWVFACNADLSGWRFRPGSVNWTQGESLGCKDTRYHEGGSEWTGGTAVYQNLYRYTAGGQQFEGSSYATGRCVPGGAVAVEYLTGQPGVSRIAGMRRQPLSWWATVGALFPGVGLAMAIAGMVKGRRRARLLREGLPAAGCLMEKVSTGARTNGRLVYRMTFEYTAQNGMTSRVTARTNSPERLEDQSRELLLYDPQDLARAFLIDDLPGTVTIDEAGQPAPGGAGAYFLLPALTLLGNGWYVYRHWIA